ncbi:flagellar motor switch protein FliG [Vulgatibacter incomptus]|uniref:Flagellar motor switch protein FliG n=1 Tax=Vulgatibacter incomptus TaxID=1391653 RepID=A0A0K1PHN8_9BACT|nr:flagellar motor switch protein FliG [Vulgatibacter incomptus]AKU93027.1 Flagellar motor switch protein FliG [Vulgatibacter incomptus]
MSESGTGARRAAALLLGLGRESAEDVVRLLGEEEVRKIALGAKELRRGQTNEVPDALRSFVASMENVGGEVQAGEELLRELTERAHGPELARRAFERGALPREPNDPLAPIGDADPEALAMILVREHPQTVALVLGSLPPEKAADTMDHLPDEMRSQVIRRMATVDSVSPEVLAEVARALTAELSAAASGGMRRVDGKHAALEILRRTPGARQSELVAEIERIDASLAAELRGKLFTFEDLSSLGDRDIQTLLKDVDIGRLAVALKGATRALVEKFVRNLSARAGQMLADDLEAKGPVRLSVVEEAQAEIVQLTRDLADQGRITIVSASDAMV